MNKSIRNADAVTHNLGPASIKATNHGLEIAGEKRRKKNEWWKSKKQKLWPQNAKKLEQQ